MAMLRPASEMKDSGIEWIGRIPYGWSIVPVLALLTKPDAMKDGPFGSDLKNEEYTDTGVPVVQLGAIQDGKFEEGKLHFITEEKADSLFRHNALPDDIVIAKMMPAGKATILPDKYTRYVVSADVIKATITKKIWSRWLVYALNAYGITQCEIQSQGATRARININKAKRIKIALPSDIEVMGCVEYLDDRCFKIDEIIAEATASIEEYKELKQAVVFEAVTKGLDKNVPMKDSGVEWLGRIPSSWSLVRIPRILDYRYAYPLGDGDHGMIKTEDYQNEGIPYIRVQNLGWGTDLLLDNVVYISAENNEKIKSSQLKPNDVLFCKTGGTIGKTGMVPEYLPVSNTTSHVGKITVNPAYNARYVFYVLSSNVGYRQFWEIACQKTTRPELSIAETRQIRLTWPSSRKEQDDIVKYLDSIVPEYDDLITEKQALIDDLQSYKKSLIYEVVTGKRRVV